MNPFKRVWRWLDRKVQDPAASPAEIGTKAGIKKTRPIPIELGFYLHADGTVYYRNRKNHSLIKCENRDLQGLVKHEYNVILEIAKKDQEILEAKAIKRKKRALKIAKRESAIDATKKGAL